MDIAQILIYALTLSVVSRKLLKTYINYIIKHHAIITCKLIVCEIWLITLWHLYYDYLNDILFKI